MLQKCLCRKLDRECTAHQQPRVKTAIVHLKKAKLWASTATVRDGLDPFPEKFTGAMVQVGGLGNYCGTLADVDLLGSEGSYPTEVQILESAEYWWSGQRLVNAPPLVIPVLASVSTKRGELIMAENIPKVVSFLVAWQQSSESKARPSTRLARVYRSCDA